MPYGWLSVLTDMSAEPHVVSRVVAASGVSRMTGVPVRADLDVLDGGVDRRLGRRPRTDAHRFRRVRFEKDDAGEVTRVAPWSIGLTDAGRTGQQGASGPCLETRGPPRRSEVVSQREFWSPLRLRQSNR